MNGLRGLLAEFAAGDEVLAATHAARLAGYVALEVYSPCPVEGVAEALAFRTRLPRVTFVAGLLGGAAIFLFQVWVHAIEWHLNIGGRPSLAAPAFIVPTFEITILSAALLTAFAMLWKNGLPRLHHPLFAVPAFARASQDRFFLFIGAGDPRFHAGHVRAFLESLAPLEVHNVPR
ncbi:DUF3341 domain-containing protein [Nannocystis radixulma]|uniref:DUF3341 domain-containing protein n=1 Tax=Nannocystis radixulma TaxID=2995305 RepID=A0ABT5B3U7_9BACT|nr:DUF3341 domain-containing protein [Nannocystis radixulma]MDC0668403.1 DUF3341 domain-containing protein [Nannocystis radixulma]